MAGNETKGGPHEDRRLRKSERICLKNDITRLFKEGKYLSAGGFRCCYVKNNGKDFNRIMISVPKRNFKKAVMRNLLKRRIREAYRNNKHLLPVPGQGSDMLIIYTNNNVRTSEDITRGIMELLARLSGNAAGLEEGRKKNPCVSADIPGWTAKRRMAGLEKDTEMPSMGRLWL